MAEATKHDVTLNNYITRSKKPDLIVVSGYVLKYFQGVGPICSTKPRNIKKKSPSSIGKESATKPPGRTKFGKAKSAKRTAEPVGDGAEPKQASKAAPKKRLRQPSRPILLFAWLPLLSLRVLVSNL